MTLKVDGTNGILQAYDYQVLTTGFSYTFAAGTTTLIANPAGTLATGTITMPAAPADGMTITFSSTKEISTLTVNANTGQSITGTPGVLPANTAMSFVYRLSNTTWYPTTISPNGTMCKAWINFATAGSAVINASFNVSSLTYNGYGDVTINFTRAFADQYYCAAMGLGRYDRIISGNSADDNTYPSWTTTSCRIITRTTAGITTGNNSECVAFFR